MTEAPVNFLPGKTLLLKVRPQRPARLPVVNFRRAAAVINGEQAPRTPTRKPCRQPAMISKMDFHPLSDRVIQCGRHRRLVFPRPQNFAGMLRSLRPCHADLAPLISRLAARELHAGKGIDELVGKEECLPPGGIQRGLNVSVPPDVSDCLQSLLLFSPQRVGYLDDVMPPSPTRPPAQRAAHVRRELTVAAAEFDQMPSAPHRHRCAVRPGPGRNRLAQRIAQRRRRGEIPSPANRPYPPGIITMLRIVKRRLHKALKRQRAAMRGDEFT